MDPSTAAEMLRQIRDGVDIPPPAKLLRNIRPEQAAEKADDSPYSILTNVAHAEFWQRDWLNRLRGRKAASFLADWKVPPPESWPDVRREFLEGLDEAIRIAETEPFEHQMKSDEVAVKTLIQIAVHDAYHLGQINLLKRQQRLRRGTAEPVS